MDTIRHLITSNGPGVSPIQKALALAVTLHAESGSTLPITLLTPANATLQSGNVVHQTIGDAAAKALLKGQTVRLSGNVMLAHDSQRSLSSHKKYGVVVAVYPTMQMLNEVDSIHGIAAIVIVPLTMAEVGEWVATWGPVIDGKANVAAVRSISSSFVEVALEHLTGSINLGTGLGHPLDKAKAVVLFRQLKKLKEIYDPKEIRAWAVRHHWAPEAADELKRIGEAILAGKAVRSEPGYAWSKEYIEQLRAEAKERGKR